MPRNIADYLRPGDRVAVGDGAGAPLSVLAALADAAEQVGGVDLLLGWCLELDAALLREEAFRDVRTIMSGYALRRPVRQGRVGYVPTRLGAVPALLAGPLRPDVLIASVRPCRGGFAWCSEVGWVAAAAERARTILGVVNEQLPITSAEAVLPANRVTIVAEAGAAPAELPAPRVDDISRAIGASVAALIPGGAAIQMGPGKIAAAALAALAEPVRVRTGVIDDSVVDLDERGLLLDTPETAYVTGTGRLYAWADGRPLARRVEYTHDVTRLSALPFFAINTALQIDSYGQVNVERIGDDPVGGVGGHGDFALAASRSPGGLSIVALPRERGGYVTLVDHLDVPASTAFPDVNVVVCEAGQADLRGLTVAQRRAALTALWSR